MSEGSTKVTFKSVKKRAIRKRRHSSDEDENEEDVNLEVLNETKEIQKLRQRSHGVNALSLNTGKKLTKVEEIITEDPFNLKSGGLVDLQKIKSAPKEDIEAYETPGHVGTQFSKETRIRDEDEEMQKFIETEMEKRKGKNDETGDRHSGNKYAPPEEKALMALPDHLRKSTFHKNEEMLSSQMLTGIPEVELGIEEKIRNIEATEAAKKIADEKAKNKKRVSEFVPTNLAVNFQQPNRFKAEVLDGNASIAAPKTHVKPKAEVKIERRVVVGDLPIEEPVTNDGASHNPNRATDDLHFTKFKQQFKRK